MSRFGGRFYSAAPHSAPSRSPPPQKASNAPPLARVQSESGGSMLRGIGSTIAQGLGSGMANRAADAVTGSRTIHHERDISESAAAAVSPSEPCNGESEACGMQSKAFHDCMNSNGKDMSKCLFYFDMLTDCLESRFV